VHDFNACAVNAFAQRVREWNYFAAITLMYLRLSEVSTNHFRSCGNAAVGLRRRKMARSAQQMMKRELAALDKLTA
jgi:hypothetical protein